MALVSGSPNNEAAAPRPTCPGRVSRRVWARYSLGRGRRCRSIRGATEPTACQPRCEQTLPRCARRALRRHGRPVHPPRAAAPRQALASPPDREGGSCERRCHQGPASGQVAPDCRRPTPPESRLVDVTIPMEMTSLVRGSRPVASLDQRTPGRARSSCWQPTHDAGQIALHT